MHIKKFQQTSINRPGDLDFNLLTSKWVLKILYRRYSMQIFLHIIIIFMFMYQNLKIFYCNSTSQKMISWD